MSHKLVSLYIGEGEYYTRTDTDNVITELKSEVAQLEDDNALLRRNNEELRKENEDLKNELYAVKTDAAMATRWRKCSDENPKEDTWCIVFHDGEIDSDHYTRFAYNKKCDFALYGNEVTHWMPLPKAPEADK